jgi:hypothetical protein
LFDKGCEIWRDIKASSKQRWTFLASYLEVLFQNSIQIKSGFLVAVGLQSFKRWNNNTESVLNTTFYGSYLRLLIVVRVPCLMQINICTEKYKAWDYVSRLYYIHYRYNHGTYLHAYSSSKVEHWYINLH